jgi:DNA-binding beta-propeller fold protein YncE
MKPNITFGSHIRSIAVLGLALSVLFFIFLLFSWQAAPTSLAQEESGESFLPVQLVPVPTPTPGPPPQFVKNVPLPGALCPSAAGFNQVSGYMYILNNYSNNVSVFRNQAFVNDIATGEWPTGVASDPQSDRTWVTNLHSGVSLLQGTAQTGFVPPSYEPYGAAFNPVNGYVYVTDLDSKVQIIDGSQEVTTIEIIDPQTGTGAGWMRPIVIDPYTGLVYAASWDYGRLWVIKDTHVIDNVQLGWGPLNMAIDTMRGLIYVAHDAPSAEYPHEISVVDLETLTVTYVNPVPGEINRARDVAVDLISGLAYVTNPDRNTVTLLKGAAVVGEVAVGKRPWGIGVNSNDGYVFVTNRDSNDVSILRNGVLLDTVAIQGKSPFAVGVDTNNNDIYIVNRGEDKDASDCKKASVSILH